MSDIRPTHRRHGTRPTATALLNRAVLVTGAVLVAVGVALSLETAPGAPVPAPREEAVRAASTSDPAVSAPDPSDHGAGDDPAGDRPTAEVPGEPAVPVVPIESAGRVPAESDISSAAPVRVRYPRLGADLPVVPTGVAADGQMEIPSDAATAGWYRYGPQPGGGAGSAVIAAHAGSTETPEGPMYAIRNAREGDEVTVTDEEGAVHVYEVSTVERLGKDGLDLSPYFARTGPERLVLITCGGRWLPERGSYADNVIVVAVPAS